MKSTLTPCTGDYSRLVCKLEFVRSMGYYLIQIYIPASLIVIISWVSFWLHRVSAVCQMFVQLIRLSVFVVVSTTPECITSSGATGCDHCVDNDHVDVIDECGVAQNILHKIN